MGFGLVGGVHRKGKGERETLRQDTKQFPHQALPEPVLAIITDRTLRQYGGVLRQTVTS